MTAASTIWGLFLLVLLLGYGLVQIPKNVYIHSRPGYILAHMQFKLSQLYNEKVDVEDKLDSLIDDLTKMCMQIKAEDLLRPSLDEVLKIVPERYTDRIQSGVDDYQNRRIVLPNSMNEYEMERKLVKLNEQLKSNIHIHHRVQTYWTQGISDAFYFEEIFNNEKNADRTFVKENLITRSWLRRKLFENHPKLGKYLLRSCSFDEHTLEWLTFCAIRPWAIRVLAITLALISLLVIWSEMTFFRTTKPILSIFAICVNAARDHHQYFIIEVREDLLKRSIEILFTGDLLAWNCLFKSLCLLHDVSYSCI